MTEFDGATARALTILTRAKVALIGEAHDRVRRFVVDLKSGLPPELCGRLGLLEVMQAYSTVDGAWKRLFRELK